MKLLVICALLVLGAESSRLPRSIFFSKESWEIDSSEHGGPPGKKSTTCPCGWANRASKRIVNGEETEVGQFPFIAALFDRYFMRQMCGATILTPHHVITAAHCTEKYVKFAGIKGYELSVLVGGHNVEDRGSNSKASQLINVGKIIQHAAYDNVKMTNDISLLLLEKPIVFSKEVGPACISPVQNTLDRQYVRIIGWGRISHTGPASDVLQKVDVRVVPLNACANRYSIINANANKQICTHGAGKGACMGDSGGPVVWVDPETNRYTLVGLVSFGRVCGSEDPSVHTDVSAYYSWIQSNIKATTPAENMCQKV